MIWFKKIVSGTSYLIFLIALTVFLDFVVLHDWLKYGYQPTREQEFHAVRSPAPYVAFTGTPYRHGNNKHGFRGKYFFKASDNDLKIAFFGGSTGYRGDPPIPETLETELKSRLNKPVYVVNYSMDGANHRQHLHQIIEYLPAFNPDIVIFYGGYNETIQNAVYDPRPGYPFNFYFVSELSPFRRFVLEHSAVLGEIDKKNGYFSGLAKLAKKERPYSKYWNKRIVEKYFETLDLAKKISSTMNSNKFGHTRFYAFYQPYQVPEAFKEPHALIQQQLSKLDYAVDVSSVYDDFGPEIYTDIVHVRQSARDAMAKHLAETLYTELQGNNSP